MRKMDQPFQTSFSGEETGTWRLVRVPCVLGHPRPTAAGLGRAAVLGLCHTHGGHRLVCTTVLRTLRDPSLPPHEADEHNLDWEGEGGRSTSQADLTGRQLLEQEAPLGWPGPFRRGELMPPSSRPRGGWGVQAGT